MSKASTGAGRGSQGNPGAETGSCIPGLLQASPPGGHYLAGYSAPGGTSQRQEAGLVGPVHDGQCLRFKAPSLLLEGETMAQNVP